MNMSEREEKKSKDLRSCIFDSIEANQLEPKARHWFFLRRISIWLLWFATVLVGAVTSAVLVYVARYQQYAVYQVTHDNGLSFIISVLPIVWILLFLTAVIVAYFEMRNTPKGYKYSFIKVIGGTTVAILILGIIFELLSLGSTVDRKLGTMTGMYTSQEARETAVWQRPEEGRMIGVTATGTIFTDVSGKQWNVVDTELKPNEVRLLRSGKEVKMYGTSTAEGLYMPCAVLPVFKEKKDLSELKQAKQEFVAKVKEYRALTKSGIVAENAVISNPCGRLPAFN